MHKVYAELVFLDNFIINLLVVLLAARLSSLRVRWGRFVLAAAVGGLYACAALSLGSAAASLPIKAVVAIAMCFIGFWARGEKRFIAGTCAFWAVSFVLAGAIYAVMLSLGEPAAIGGVIIVRAPVRAILIGLCAGAVLITVIGHIRRQAQKRGQNSERISLFIDQQQIHVNAFVDTGNLVCEPLSGCGVIFLSREIAKELLGSKLYALTQGCGKLQTDRLRIVPCETAAGKELLYGIQIDKVVLAGQYSGISAVVCAAGRPLPGDCGAIVGSSMIDQLKKGAENKDAYNSKNNGVGSAAPSAGVERRLYQRQRGTAASADETGGSGSAALAGGGGQVGKADTH